MIAESQAPPFTAELHIVLQGLRPVLERRLRRLRRGGLRLGSHDVDDVLQTTFMKALSNRQRFQGGESAFRNWLCRIAWHEAIDHLRRLAVWHRRHDRGVDVTLLGHVVSPGNGEDSELLSTTLGMLSDTERAVLDRWLNRSTDTDTGIALGISKHRVRRIRKRAVQRLRESHEEEHP